MNLIIGALAMAGFFTGVAVTIAWNRVTLWKSMPDEQFKVDFSQTLRIADKLQPALLVTTLALTLWFAFTARGILQILAFIAAVLQAIILIASIFILVPLQKRIIDSLNNEANTQAVHALRDRWCTGHIGRSVLALAMFLLLIFCALVASNN